MNKHTYEMFFKVTKIGNRAVKKAQEENRKNGIPNVYSRDGKIYFELPDGTITTDYSFENITSKQSNPRFT